MSSWSRTGAGSARSARGRGPPQKNSKAQRAGSPLRPSPPRVGPPSFERDPAGAVGVVDRELLPPAQTTATSSAPCSLAAARATGASRLSREPTEQGDTARGGSEQEPRPVRRRTRASSSPPRASTTPRGELPKSKPSIRTVLRSAAEDGAALGPPRPPAPPRPREQQRTRSISRRERLGDRRGRAQDVDHDSERRKDLLGRCESDMDAHRRYASCDGPPATATPTARPGCRAPTAGARSAPTA